MLTKPSAIASVTPPNSPKVVEQRCSMKFQQKLQFVAALGHRPFARLAVARQGAAHECILADWPCLRWAVQLPPSRLQQKVIENEQLSHAR
jgi:hypothetical protein